MLCFQKISFQIIYNWNFIETDADIQNFFFFFFFSSVDLLSIYFRFNMFNNRQLGQRHVNHPPIDNPYKCHENTNHSRVPQLSKAPIPTSKWKYVPNLLQT